VRWSDDSLSLAIGNEFFDIHANELSTDDAAALGSQGLTYLVAEHRSELLLEAQTSVTGTMSFVPTTLQSAAHRRLASAVTGAHVKGTRTKLVQVEKDPEAERIEKEHEEALRARARRKAAVDAGGGGGGNAAARRKRRSMRSMRLGDMSTSEEEEEEEEGATTGRARRGARLEQGLNDFVVDDEEAQEEDAEAEAEEDEADLMDAKAEATFRRGKKPGRHGEDSDASGEVDDATGEQDMDVDSDQGGVPKKPSPAAAVEEAGPIQKKRLVVEDSD
jgi:RNA polymerase-associated protein LEO1